MAQTEAQENEAQVSTQEPENAERPKAISERVRIGVDDEGTEPVDDSLPPDGIDIIHEQDRKAGRPLTPIERITQERHRRCLDLRVAGVSYRAIAEQMGYSGPGPAFKACQAARRDLAAPEESAVELRSLTYQRLSEALQRIWPRALGGYMLPGKTTPEPPSLEHMREARALMAQMVELMGAKSAQPTQHHTVSGDVAVGVSGVVAHAHGHTIIESEWDEDRFVAEMRRNTSEGLADTMGGTMHEIKPPTGYIAPQLTENEFVEAEVIEANTTDEDEEPVFDPRKAITFD